MSEPSLGNISTFTVPSCGTIRFNKISACDVVTNVINLNQIFINETDVTNNILQGCNVVTIDASTNDAFFDSSLHQRVHLLIR